MPLLRTLTAEGLSMPEALILVLVLLFTRLPDEIV